jgi:dienelactone hydrolase
MTHVVLFHSVYGLRPAVTDAAARLREAGHEVRTPDLYEGRVAQEVEVGRGIREEIGIPELLRRAAAAVEGSPAATVYAGFSMGAAIADHLARLDPGAGGLVLLHAFGDAEAPSQPTCRAQAHVSADDPFLSEDDERAWLKAYGPLAKAYTYSGGGHLYTDPGLPDYDPRAADLTWQRVLAFLAA